MTGTVLAARGVGVRLGGVDIVSGVGLDVAAGTVVALVGPNGAGKSTLLAALAGDLPTCAGRVELDGRPLADWTPRQLARRRAVLPQANRLSFPFTVGEVVAMGRAPWTSRSTLEQDASAVARALADTDVADLVHRPFPTLSGGEQARVSLARVLAQDAPVVLLDEPTAALDLRHQEDVMAVARTLAGRGRAVVVVLHDLSLAAAWADRVAVLAHGRLVAEGTPAEVLTPVLLGAVYGIGVHVLTDTPDGHPVIVPRRPPLASPEGPAGVLEEGIRP